MAGETILIVEDNPLNMELATDLLEAAGYVVRQAGTAEEAMQAAKAGSLKLILMDVSLPGMDGLAATKALKADPSTKSIPVIAVTAHAMKGDEEKARAAGCEGYITKPIDTRDFPATVARVLASTAKG